MRGPAPGETFGHEVVLEHDTRLRSLRGGQRNRRLAGVSDPRLGTEGSGHPLREDGVVMDAPVDFQACDGNGDIRDAGKAATMVSRSLGIGAPRAWIAVNPAPAWRHREASATRTQPAERSGEYLSLRIYEISPWLRRTAGLRCCESAAGG